MYGTVLLNLGKLLTRMKALPFSSYRSYVIITFTISRHRLLVVLPNLSKNISHSIVLKAINK